MQIPCIKMHGIFFILLRVLIIYNFRENKIYQYAKAK